MSVDRLHEYLRVLASRDWGDPAPEAFAGRTCFQCIPALELERRGEDPGHFRPTWIDHSLGLLHRRVDCQDFAMVGLLRMLHGYPRSRLLEARREAISAALLAAKYAAKDPGDDTCCWSTENHQVQYASSELLAAQLWPDARFGCTGRSGSWHRQRAREKLHLWLDWRLRFSFSEWNSSCYYDEDLAAVLNLAEFADDAGLRDKAGRVATLLGLHVAANSWRGMTGASQGRAYLDQEIAPDGTAMATLAQVCWGDGEVPQRLSLGTVLLAAGAFRLPEAVSLLGRCEELEHREVHGLDADAAAAFGVHPDRDRDLDFFLGAGQGSHHLVVDARHAREDGCAPWPGYFADRDWYRRSAAAGRAFDTWCLPHALGRAELYTHRTPEFMLGCAQAYHPGAPGYQQLIWSATLGRRAVVFTTNPCPADIPYGRPGPWVGNGVLPQVVQHRNVLIALHRVRRVPIYDQPPWYGEPRVHAYVPRGAFSEWRERDGWFLARAEHGGYLGLRPSAPAAWLPPDPAISEVIGSPEPYEWNVDGCAVAWICELGSARTHGSFDAFCDALAQATISGDLDAISYMSPTLGRIETGWGRGLRVAGRDQPIRGYPLLADAWGHHPFGEPFAHA